MSHRGRKNVDERLVALLAAGRTVRAAARLCGIAERTVFRRLRDRGFCERVHAAKAAGLKRATARLGHDATAATQTLRRLLDSQLDAVRLGACRAILELACKCRDAVEIEERLAALEKEIEQAEA